jgi:hypothetical protein
MNSKLKVFLYAILILVSSLGFAVDVDVDVDVDGLQDYQVSNKNNGKYLKCLHSYSNYL